MKYYNVKEISALLSVNEETVRRWIREGKLNAERGVGRQGSKISSRDLEKLLKENSALMTSAASIALATSPAALGAIGAGIGVLAGATVGGVGIAASAGIGLALGIAKSWKNIINQKDKSKDEVKLELVNEELKLENAVMVLKNEILNLKNQVSIKENELKVLENLLAKITEYTSQE